VSEIHPKENNIQINRINAIKLGRMSPIESIVSLWVWDNFVTLTLKQQRTKKVNAKIKTAKLYEYEAKNLF